MACDQKIQGKEIQENVKRRASLIEDSKRDMIQMRADVAAKAALEVKNAVEQVPEIVIEEAATEEEETSREQEGSEVLPKIDAGHVDALGEAIDEASMETTVEVEVVKKQEVAAVDNEASTEVAPAPSEPALKTSEELKENIGVDAIPTINATSDLPQDGQDQAKAEKQAETNTEVVPPEVVPPEVVPPEVVAEATTEVIPAEASKEAVVEANEKLTEVVTNEKLTEVVTDEKLTAEKKDDGKATEENTAKITTEGKSPPPETEEEAAQHLAAEAEANEAAAAAEKGTRLLEAAEGGDIETVLLMIRDRENLNYESPEGATALIKAAEHGKLDVVDVILQSGAEVDYENKVGKTALMEACRVDALESVKALVASGADIVRCNRFGQTPLEIARESKFDQCALWLQAVMSEGARSAIIQERREREAKAQENFEALQDAAAEEEEAKNLTNALIQATLRGHIGEVKTLLVKKADPAAVRGSDGSSALLWASRLARHSVIEEMRQAGTSMDSEVDTA